MSAAAPQTAKFADVLEDVRCQRAELAAQWDELCRALGHPEIPSEADVERAMHALPADDREELRRFREETVALVASLQSPVRAAVATTTRPLASHPPFRNAIRG